MPVQQYPCKDQLSSDLLLSDCQVQIIVVMGGCIPDKAGIMRANPRRSNNNPIQKIIQDYSIERLREKWRSQQLNTIQKKVQGFQNTNINLSEFGKLFPKIKSFSTPTQNKIYELFSYEGNKDQLSKPELINSLTLIRKVTANNDFAPFLFYIYTNDPKHEIMSSQEFTLFQQENQKYLSQFDELQQLESEVEQHNGLSININANSKNNSPSILVTQKKADQPKQIKIKSNGNIAKAQGNTITLDSFKTKFEKYSLDAYQILFSWDPEEEEKELIEQISKSGVVRHRGDKVFILDYQWWLAWKIYAEAKLNKTIEVIQDDNPNYTSTKFFRKRSSSIKMIEFGKANGKPEPPGQIRNNCLLKRSKTRGTELAQNLVEFYNYICLPQDFWNKLVAIYHGGPAIERIFPQIYHNLILKVVLGQNGHFQSKPPKKYTNKDQKLISDYANENQITYNPYYKYPGRNNWVKFDQQCSLDTIFDNPRTYLVFVPTQLQKLFVSNYNIQEKAEGKYLKERLLNFGSEVNVSVDGVLTKAEVTDLLSPDEIRASYLDDYGISRQVTLRIDESARILNPSNLDSEKQLNQFSGFSNIGNTCYMNAVLQCLIKTPAFGSYLQQQNFKDKRVGEDLVLEELLTLYTSSKANSQQCVTTRNFKRVFDKYCPFFQGNLQHDAQEFLICLLSRISEQIKSKKQQYGANKQQPSNSFVKQERQQQLNKKVVKFFSGKIEAITQCSHCKNKNSRVQSFFTYSLSLPPLEQTQYFYFFVEAPEKTKSTVPVRYGITLSRKVTVEQFMSSVAKAHHKQLQNIALYTVFNNQILNRLQPVSWQNEIAHHLNFNVRLVCYQLQYMHSPTYYHYKERKLHDKSVKIELQQRIYAQKSHEYRIIYIPFILEVTSQMKWKDLMYKVNTIIKKLHNSDPTPNPGTTSELKLKQSDIRLKLQSSGLDGLSSSFMKNSVSGIKKSEIQVAHIGNYKVRVIKDDHYYQNYCMFCKEEFVLTRRSRGTKACKGDKCKFDQNLTLFEDQEFRNYSDAIIITVDWQDSIPDLPQFTNHPSYDETLALADNRKSFLQDLLVANFKNRQTLELKCDKQDCGFETAQRIERIYNPPNILLIHLKRFSYEDNRLLKLTNHVVYPSTLTLPGTDQHYELYAVVVHIGSGVGGHYISYVQVKNKWYRCDDSKVILATPGQHIDPNAYILFYKKVKFQPSLICLSF